MKQTAVEWLVSELNQKIDFIPIDKWDMIRDIVQQAKEIEKEQSERRYSEEEAFGIIYVLETLLDFAGEAKEDSINISTTDAEKIIKLLKQI